MNYLIASLIFAVLSAATWYAAVSLYQATFQDPDLTAHADYGNISAGVILVVTLTYFAPFPAGYFLALGAWAFAVFTYLELSAIRGGVLFAYLAAGSILSRAMVLGVLEMLPR